MAKKKTVTIQFDLISFILSSIHSPNGRTRTARDDKCSTIYSNLCFGPNTNPNINRLRMYGARDKKKKRTNKMGENLTAII